MMQTATPLALREAGVITGYHAHVYFDEASWPAAHRLYLLVPSLFRIHMGGILQQAFGPHPKPMYQISFSPAQFGEFVPWLMLNRQGLSVLVHPLVNDEVFEHSFFACWLGPPLPLNLPGLRTFQPGDETRTPWPASIHNVRPQSGHQPSP